MITYAAGGGVASLRAVYDGVYERPGPPGRDLGRARILAAIESRP